MRIDGSYSAFRFLYLPLAFWAVMVLGSYLWNANELEETMLSLVDNRAAGFFKMIQLQRIWNAGHGGVYVPLSKETPSNPYLDDPLRDVATTDGLRLTKLNPAYMTRQMSELAEEHGIIVFHITSKRPLRPENRPDRWEWSALEEFESGAERKLEMIDIGSEKVFRYMAPLFVEDQCLKCHAKQGYISGDVRGGISIMIPAGPFLTSQRSQVVMLKVIHYGMFLAGALLIGGINILSSRAIDALKERQERYRILIESGNDAIFVYGFMDNGMPSRFVEVNDIACVRLGYKREELLDMSPADIVPPERLQEILGMMEILAASRYAIFETEHRARDGTRTPVEINAHLFEMKGEHFVLSIARDITERKNLEDTLRKISVVDGLTGISNRRHFDEVLEQEWKRARREKAEISAVLFDIDFFKKYNDIYGHLAGDDCLRMVSDCLKRAIRRPGDLLARYGGEEFVVLLPSTGLEGAADIAESVRKKVQGLMIPHEGSSIDRYLTISAGVASVAPDETTPSVTLIENADSALYRAKEEGRNLVRKHEA